MHTHTYKHANTHAIAHVRMDTEFYLPTHARRLRLWTNCHNRDYFLLLSYLCTT